MNTLPALPGSWKLPPLRSTSPGILRRSPIPAPQRRWILLLREQTAGDSGKWNSPKDVSKDNIDRQHLPVHLVIVPARG